jgi:hypothetical protein
MMCFFFKKQNDVDVEREGEYGEGGKDEGVEEDGLAVGAEASKVDVTVGARELAQQGEHHTHHHGTPVHHRHPAGERERSDHRSFLSP